MTDFNANQIGFDFRFVDEPEQPTQKRKYTMRKQKQTPAVVMTVIGECINKLKVTGSIFKIILPNGETVVHDPDELLSKRKHNPDPNRPYAHGDLCKRYKPLIENMKPGDVACVPYDDLHPAEKLQSSMTAWMSSTWGKQTYQSITNKDTGHIEVLRLK